MNRRWISWDIATAGGALLFASVCMNLSWLQGEHNADTLLPALISTESWSPFYWGENRYGMLVPFLTSFVKDVRWNLLLQTQIMILAVFALIVVFNRWFVRDPDVFPRSCLAAALLVLLFRPTGRVAQLVMTQPYVLSLLLGLSAIAVLRRRKHYAFGAFLLLLACWVNSSIAPVAVLLMALLPPFGRRYLQERLPSLGIAVLAYAAIRVLASYSPQLETPAFAPLAELPNTVRQLWTNTVETIIHPWRVLLLLSLCSIGATFTYRGKRTPASAFPTSEQERSVWPAFAGTAVVFALFVASLDWVSMNLYEPRYWSMSILLILLPAVSYVALQTYTFLAAATESRSVAAMISALALAALAIKTFGTPSVSAALVRIDSVAGRNYASIEKLGCTHIVGDYWTAWSAVFYNRSRHLAPKLWAATGRGNQLMATWYFNTAQPRTYCGVCGDSSNTYMAVQFRLPPLQEADRNGAICRLTERSTSSSNAISTKPQP